MASSANSHHARSPLLIALTGSIGSGKSTFCAMLAAHGAAIIDADLLAREVVAPGTDGLLLVAQRFGRAVLQPDGSLNRSALGELVFNSASLRKELETILHPRIRERFLARVQALRESPQAPSIIVYAVPLLFESGYPIEEFDRTIVLVAPENDRLGRIMRRDGCSEDLARNKLAAQLSDEVKASRADITIVNDGTIAALETKAQRLMDSLHGRRA